MPTMILSLLSLLPLGAMIVSDLRERRVAVVWLAAFGVLQLSSAIAGQGVRTVCLNLAANIAFLALLYASLWIWLKCSKRNVREAVGVGDLLFLPMLAPCFELRGYVIFLTISFLLSLAAWGVFHRMASVPLVSTVGICFMVWSAYGLMS